jgi:predicted metal-dependent phosphoesterase TrpH
MQNSQLLVDLHVHSSASDGSFSPQELIDLALKQNVGTLVLCDHDTTAGLDEFISYSNDKAIQAICGVELSATWETGNCHIVGLGVSNNYGPLEHLLQEFRDSRDNRNLKIVGKLNEFGIDITMDEIESLAGGDVVARPHIARIMLQKGFVSSTQEAFDKYLAKGAPAYIDRYRLEPEKAVQILKEAGGKVILAHPSQLKRDVTELDTFVKKLVPFGLAGMEVYTPYTSDDLLDKYITIARKYNLHITGGSDFHGESKPDHIMGYYRADKPIPPSCAEIVEKKDVHRRNRRERGGENR